jgi:hypothetical protein
VRLLQQIDPARFARLQQADAQYHAAVTELGHRATQQQAQQAQQFRQWADSQDKLFAERAPELADPVHGPRLRQDALNTLKDAGFSHEELAASWNGGQLRDHRVQTLVRKAALFDRAMAEGRKPSPRAAPSVQHPRASRPRGAEGDDAVRHFSEELGRGGGVRAAAALLIARRNRE